ncbi:hypothetical protein KP509_01G071100 [Ceratopteris richardii]|uniref:Uncharacterized protein n=1 Tax=Ceratopteris richardii TaxID=49495 RepID=A0A8T2VME4_CERRI|nr:hypothetical protein KP509_01G071100 [Ceratopteris richardii]
MSLAIHPSMGWMQMREREPRCWVDSLLSMSNLQFHHATSWSCPSYRTLHLSCFLHKNRQQRIFSDQVFELHKLVEVQKLIAENSDIPINEIYFGVGSMIIDHHNDDSSCDSHDKGKNIIEIPDSIRLPSVVAEGNSVQQSPKSPANTVAMVNQANKYESSRVAPLASVIACSADLEPGPATGGSIPILVRCDEAATVKFPFSESFADSSEQPELKDNVPPVFLQQFLLNNHHCSANTVMNLSETVTLDKKECEQGLSSVVYIVKGNDWDAVQQQRHPPCSALISSHPKKVEQEAEVHRSPRDM